MNGDDSRPTANRSEPADEAAALSRRDALRLASATVLLSAGLGVVVNEATARALGLSGATEEYAIQMKWYLEKELVVQDRLPERLVELLLRKGSAVQLKWYLEGDGRTELVGVDEPGAMFMHKEWE